ncbi:MAG: hypothetical protein MK101_08475 [Phycisphaerales bacterium]|nr:hypothetical protein [Phycisphaerales bacterium]
MWDENDQWDSFNISNETYTEASVDWWEADVAMIGGASAQVIGALAVDQAADGSGATIAADSAMLLEAQFMGQYPAASAFNTVSISFETHQTMEWSIEFVMNSWVMGGVSSDWFHASAAVSLISTDTQDTIWTTAIEGDGGAAAGVADGILGPGAYTLVYTDQAWEDYAALFFDGTATGVSSDVSFTWSAVPGPGALGLLPLVAMVGRRRR